MNLDSIIHNKESREIFERYIGCISSWGEITSLDNPNDNQRLDDFIKYYSGHNGKPLDYILLKSWLIKEKRLSDNDVQKIMSHFQKRWRKISL